MIFPATLIEAPFTGVWLTVLYSNNISIVVCTSNKNKLKIVHS
jgi:hypothetical protein